MLKRILSLFLVLFLFSSCAVSEIASSSSEEASSVVSSEESSSIVSSEHLSSSKESASSTTNENTSDADYSALSKLIQKSYKHTSTTIDNVTTTVYSIHILSIQPITFSIINDNSYSVAGSIDFTLSDESGNKIASDSVNIPICPPGFPMMIPYNPDSPFSSIDISPSISPVKSVYGYDPDIVEKEHFSFSSTNEQFGFRVYNNSETECNILSFIIFYNNGNVVYSSNVYSDSPVSPSKYFEPVFPALDAFSMLSYDEYKIYSFGIPSE